MLRPRARLGSSHRPNENDLNSTQTQKNFSLDFKFMTKNPLQPQQSDEFLFELRTAADICIFSRGKAARDYFILIVEITEVRPGMAVSVWLSLPCLALT